MLGFCKYQNNRVLEPGYQNGIGSQALCSHFWIGFLLSSSAFV
jgi:hypothetical protein